MNRKISPEVVGKRLRELRGVRTRTGVARETGISYSALSKFEDGLRIPSDEVKIRIAEYYGTTVQKIFF